MKKQFKETTKYTPNKKVIVIVTNTPQLEDGILTGYKRAVRIAINEGEEAGKLEFKEDDALAKYIETVDFEDPQQSLLDE